jgi:putative transposase
MPPAPRNRRVPTAGAIPTATAASSLECPAAIAAQNRTRSSRRVAGGRPGDRRRARPDRSERRFPVAIASSNVEALRRPIESAQFTSIDFIQVLKDAEIAISMDGKGAWRDNVFVERLWRTIKYEEVYLRAYVGVTQARASVGRYLGFYNGKRPHSSLGGKTPDQAYINVATPIPAAA